MPFYGKWQTIKDEEDILTQTRDVRIAMPQKGRRSLPSSDFVLIIGCSQNELNLYVGWRIHVSDYFWTTVEHRIDDGPVETWEWPLSTSLDATYLPGEIVVDTVRKLFNADEFVIRVVPEESDPLTAVFDPAGLYWAVKPVLEACEQEIN